MTSTHAVRSIGFAAALMGASFTQALAQEAELPLGQPVELQVGDTYVAETYGDWQIRCIKQEEGVREPCQMYQLLLDTDGNSVAEMTIFALPPGQEAIAGANVITPLETALAEGVQLFVDDSQPLAYGFDFCNRLGCYARMGFPATMVDEMKNGAIAGIRMVPFANPGTEVIVTASLRGFTDAFEFMQGRLAAE